jgi:EAL domain-containing protein (putative c-di-GMP-specific phosphodiesterase class I)
MNAEYLLSPLSLIELMEAKRYGVEYQPIIDVANQSVFAFECLARFFNRANKSIPPDVVFASLHKSPLSLFQVEYEQKKLQLSNAPDDAKIFVNLDQDSYFSCCSEGAQNPFLELFSNCQKANIVIELIENSEINDSKMSLAMIDDLSKHKVKTAIDDVFNPQSMISTSVLQLVDFIKLDNYVVRNRHNEDLLRLVRSIIDYAHLSEKKIILEGIESNADLQFAKQLNVDYVQGYLYQDRFINILAQ